MSQKKVKSKQKKKIGKITQPSNSRHGLHITVATVGLSAILAGVLLVSQHTKCHISGQLPDKKCTPGTIDPSVTQANIQQTICVSGYSAKVRPPTSFTNKLKLEQIKEYGFTDANLADYEEDHLISLELGGNPTDPKNLWPEPGNSPNPKDTIENRCRKKVCANQITLAVAQKQIATNWQTACQ